MTEEVLDVKLADETAADSSPDEQTIDLESEPSSEDVNAPEEEIEESNTEWREKRLNKEIDKRKAAEELLQTYLELENTGTNVPEVPQSEASRKEQFSSVEDWQAYIKQTAQSAASDAEKRARGAIQRDVERRELETLEDFPVYKDTMIQEIKSNPTLSPVDAYHLAKARNPILGERDKARIEAEVRQEVEDKQKAQVGKSASRTQTAKLEPDIFKEKDENGKFKYSLKDLQEMLGKTK